MMSLPTRGHWSQLGRNGPDVPLSQALHSTQAPCSPCALLTTWTAGCLASKFRNSPSPLSATLGAPLTSWNSDSTFGPEINCLPPWMPPVLSLPPPSLKFSPSCVRRIPNSSVLAWVCSLGHGVECDLSHSLFFLSFSFWTFVYKSQYLFCTYSPSQFTLASFQVSSG